MNEDFSAIEARAEALVDSDADLLRDLIAMRKKHHLSQEDVAERMGVTQPTVAAFERFDSNPTLGTIRRYALAVGALVRHDVIDDCHPVSAGGLRATVGGRVSPAWTTNPALGSWGKSSKKLVTRA